MLGYFIVTLPGPPNFSVSKALHCRLNYVTLYCGGNRKLMALYLSTTMPHHYDNSPFVREPWLEMSRFSFESKKTYHFIKYARLSVPFMPKLSVDIFLFTLGSASCSGELFDNFPVTATR